MARIAWSKLVMMVIVVALAVSTLLTACAQPSSTAGTTSIVTTTVTKTAAPASTEKTYSLTLQSNSLPGQVLHDELTTMIDNIKAASGGRINIKLTGSGTVVPDLEMFRAVQDGVLDMVFTSAAYQAGTMPIAKFQYNYPGQFRNKWDLIEALWDGLRGIYREAYAEKGVYYIDEIIDMELDLFTTKPFKTLADLKGMKIRLAGGSMADLLRDLAGVSAVVMPATDIYTSLATKVIDGYVYGFLGSAQIIGAEDIVKYFMDPSLFAAHGGSGLLMRMQTWNSLPPDVQTIIRLAAYDFCVNQPLSYERRWQIKAKLLAKGVTPVTLPDSDYKAVADWTKVALDKLAVEDPKYTGKAVELMKKIMAAR